MIDLFYPLIQPNSFWDQFGLECPKRQKGRENDFGARSQRPLVAILVGSTSSREIQYAVKPLLNINCFDYPTGIEVRCQANLVNLLTAHIDPPNLIVLLESYPGEYSGSDVETLKTRFPLTPIVLVYSSWGAGETRTGFPLPVLLRVSWLEAPIWFSVQLTRLAQGRLSLLSVPESASRSQLSLYEFLISTEDAAETENASYCSIILFSDSEAMRSLFIDWATAASGRLVRVFRTTEFESVCRVLGKEPQRVCLDPNVEDKSIIERFRSIRESVPDSRFLVYLSQPDHRLVDCFYQAGANVVYPK